MKRLAFLLVCLMLLLSNSVGAQLGLSESSSAEGTGNTYGHVVNLMVENDGNDDLLFDLPPLIIPSSGKHQAYVIPQGTETVIPHGKSVSIPLYGYCLDPRLPAIPEGHRTPPPAEWILVLSESTILLPEIERTLESKIPCVISPETLADGSLDWSQHADEMVTYTYLLNECVLQSSYAPREVPAAEAVQQAVWMISSQLSGSTWTQEDAQAVWTQLALDASQNPQSLAFIMGTESIWITAEWMVSQWLCDAESTQPRPILDWDDSNLQLFNSQAVNPEDRQTSSQPLPVPRVPSVPPVPPVPPTLECAPRYEMFPTPEMQGGLNEYSVGTFECKHTELLPLVAEGADADELIFYCEPGESCPESNSLRREGLTSRVKYQWELISGPGHFVQNKIVVVDRKGNMECTKDSVYISNEKVVLFSPPDLSGTTTQKDSSTTSTIRLTIFDDLPGQPIDLPVERIIEIICSRDTSMQFDSLRIEVKGPTFSEYAQPDPILEEGTCLTQPFQWTQTDDLKKPIAEPRPDIIYSKQKTILRAFEQRDPDELTLNCSTQCDTDPIQLMLEDEVIFEWRLLGSMEENGYFLEGGNLATANCWGQEVIYQAPEMKDELRKEVLIEVKMYNQPSYPLLYNRSPVLSKAIDEIARDTLRLLIDCAPQGKKPPTVVVIGWTDKLLDHDDPWMVETLKNTSQVVSVEVHPNECEPHLNWKYRYGHGEAGTVKVRPSATDHDPQTDDAWVGEPVCISQGNLFFLFDVGYIIDDGFLTLPSDSAMKEFVKFEQELLELMTYFSVYPRTLALLDPGSHLSSSMLNFSDLLLSILTTGDVPDDNPFFLEMIDDYLKENPGKSREEAIAFLKGELPMYNEGWQNHPIVKKYELGLIYSWWIVLSQPSNCLDPCPVTIDHFTWSSLGDTDHSYSRKSQVQVISFHNGQAHFHTYNFNHENTGADFD